MQQIVHSAVTNDTALPRSAAPLRDDEQSDPRAEERAVRRTRRQARRRRARTWALRLFALIMLLLTAGASTYAWRPALQANLAAATSGSQWDLAAWTTDALGEKVVSAVQRPAAGFADAEGAAFVVAFMERGGEIVDLEREIARLSAERDSALLTQPAPDAPAPDAPAPDAPVPGVPDALAERLAALRATQEAQRPTAEAIIEGQLTTVLADLGIGVAGQPWPPVLFTFTESPAKVIVSPRDRVGTAVAQMISPGLPLDGVEAIEAAIEQGAQEAGGVSAYVAPTGGLGAFPTLVVNRGDLEWILSTVAHEWVHTWLAFFPLGFSYGRTPDNTLINETVAEIAGNEIGRMVLERYYPALVPPDMAEGSEPGGSEQIMPLLPPDEPPAFDFRAEMRQTRETLDKLLSVGRIVDAEQYLEIRRLHFVENGYPIRKLNQGYFAFHGAYGTSAAASVQPDALGPVVEALRAASPDVVSFLRTVRSIVDREGVERLLEEHGGALPAALSALP